MVVENFYECLVLSGMIKKTNRYSMGMENFDVTQVKITYNRNLFSKLIWFEKSKML